MKNKKEVFCEDCFYLRKKKAGYEIKYLCECPLVCDRRVNKTPIHNEPDSKTYGNCYELNKDNDCKYFKENTEDNRLIFTTSIFFATILFFGILMLLKY